MSRREVLSDHHQYGKKLVTSFTHELGPLNEVSWVNTIIPEVLWIALVQSDYGHGEGVEIITDLARAAREIRPGRPNETIFGWASAYSGLSAADWASVRHKLGPGEPLRSLQRSLEPLAALYPKFPMQGLLSEGAAVAPGYLDRVRDTVASLYQRAHRDPMLVQATVVWLAFDADALKVAEGLALARFPEIERYPETELSRQVGAGVRSSLNMLFSTEGSNHEWPRYFWNRGIELDPCDL